MKSILSMATVMALQTGLLTWSLYSPYHITTSVVAAAMAFHIVLTLDLIRKNA